MRFLFKYSLIVLLFVSAGNLYAQNISEKSMEQADELFYEGKKYARNQEYQKAIECFGEAVKYNPNHYEAFHAWGASILNLSGMEDAKLMKQGIEKIRTASEMAPTEKTFKQNLATALFHLGDITSDNSKFEESLSIFESLKNDAEKLSDLYDDWGTTLFYYSKKNNILAKNEDKIASLLRKGYNPNGKNYSTYNLACMYSLLNKKEEALLWLDESIINNKREKSTIDEDEDFDNIRKDKDFVRLMNRHYVSNTKIPYVDETIRVPDYTSYFGVEPVYQGVEPDSYPGGVAAVGRFLYQNLRIPADALKYGFRGRMVVKFAVDVDGTIVEPYIFYPIYKGIIGKEYNEEVLRVVRLIRKWTPGEENGKVVPTEYALPIQFNEKGTIKL